MPVYSCPRNSIGRRGNVQWRGLTIYLLSAWRVLYAAQREHRLATSGPYARLRHPQYLGFILVMSGFLVQWPTLVTLAMFPVLVFMYWRLARREEQDIAAEFGTSYAQYRAKTPAFWPWPKR